MDAERDFIALLKKRDPHALEQLYREKGDMIYNYILYRVNGTATVADDIHSEVFCDAIDYASSLTFEHNVTSWLYRIARSKIANYYRFLKRKHKLEISKPFDTLKLGSKSESPEIAMLMKEHKLVIHAAFSRLSEEHRTVLKKKYVDDCSMKEIAASIGKTGKAVESLIYRARGQFQKELRRLSKQRIYIRRDEG